MWFKLRKKSEKKEMLYRLLEVNWRSFRTRSKDIKLRLKSSRNSFINLKKTSRNMVLRHLRQTLNTINAWSKLSLRIIWSQSFKRKTSRPKDVWSNNKTYMRLLDLIEICIQRTFLKLRKKLQSLKWSSEEWPSKYLSSKRRYKQKIILLQLKLTQSRGMLLKMLSSRVILKK
jgi:hypothetical protein